MKCSEITTRLGRWYDGELDGAVAREVESHVEACSSCAEEIRQWRRVDQLLFVEPNTDGFLESTMSALARESRGTPGWWLKIAAAAVMATGLGAAGGSLLWNEPEHRTAAGFESLDVLEENFGPSALAGFDDLAGDVRTIARGDS